MFGDLKAVAAGGVCLILGLLLGGSAAVVYSDWVTVPAAREAGASAERTIWQRRESEAIAARTAERIATQERIAAIETDYHAREAEAAKQTAALNDALETALREEAAHVPVSSSPGDARACRPVIRRGVSERLNGIGRAGTGTHSAGRDAALR